jgi:hypothetical protein
LPQAELQPQVKLQPITLQDGYHDDELNLFLPFCIHEGEEKRDSKIAYDKEYFRQTIEVTSRAYPKKMLNILVADTLDNHNRQNETGKDDGDRWIALHKPILAELGLVEGEHYMIHRWDNFLEPAREEPEGGGLSYLERFEQQVKRSETLSKMFRRMAKSFQQKNRQGFNALSGDEKQRFIEQSLQYFLEDYGVTFFIAFQQKPVLFFADCKNHDIVKVFKQCNDLRLNGAGGIAHLRLREDSALVEQKANEAGNSGVSPAQTQASLFKRTPKKTKGDLRGKIEKLQETVEDLKEKVHKLVDIIQRQNTPPPHQGEKSAASSPASSCGCSL